MHAVLITIPAVQSGRAMQQGQTAIKMQIKLIVYSTVRHRDKQKTICCGIEKEKRKLCIFVPYFKKLWNCSLVAVQAHASDQALPIL